MSTTYYDLLGVERTATEDEIQKAFEKKVEELGETFEDTEQLFLVEEGYHVLMNAEARADYDDRLRVMSLFTRFESEEPEWVEGYHMQLATMSDVELDILEPELDSIYAQIEFKKNSEIKRELQRLIAHTRSERCKSQLRSTILPYIRQLPKEHQKPTLARILDLFGNLAITDDEVFLRGIHMVKKLLYPKKRHSSSASQPATAGKEKSKGNSSPPQAAADSSSSNSSSSDTKPDPPPKRKEETPPAGKADPALAKKSSLRQQGSFGSVTRARRSSSINSRRVSIADGTVSGEIARRISSHLLKGKTESGTGPAASSTSPTSPALPPAPTSPPLGKPPMHTASIPREHSPPKKAELPPAATTTAAAVTPNEALSAESPSKKKKKSKKGKKDDKSSKGAASPPKGSRPKELLPVDPNKGHSDTSDDDSTEEVATAFHSSFKIPGSPPKTHAVPSSPPLPAQPLPPTADSAGSPPAGKTTSAPKISDQLAPRITTPPLAGGGAIKNGTDINVGTDTEMVTSFYTVDGTTVQNVAPKPTSGEPKSASGSGSSSRPPDHVLSVEEITLQAPTLTNMAAIAQLVGAQEVKPTSPPKKSASPPRARAVEPAPTTAAAPASSSSPKHDIEDERPGSPPAEALNKTVLYRRSMHKLSIGVGEDLETLTPKGDANYPDGGEPLTEKALQALASKLGKESPEKVIEQQVQQLLDLPQSIPRALGGSFQLPSARNRLSSGIIRTPSSRLSASGIAPGGAAARSSPCLRPRSPGSMARQPNSGDLLDMSLPQSVMTESDEADKKYDVARRAWQQREKELLAIIERGLGVHLRELSVVMEHWSKNLQRAFEEASKQIVSSVRLSHGIPPTPAYAPHTQPPSQQQPHAHSNVDLVVVYEYDHRLALLTEWQVGLSVMIRTYPKFPPGMCMAAKDQRHELFHTRLLRLLRDSEAAKDTLRHDLNVLFRKSRKVMECHVVPPNTLAMVQSSSPQRRETSNEDDHRITQLRCELNQANELVHRREAELEEVKRTFASLQTSCMLKDEQIGQLQRNITTLCDQLREQRPPSVGQASPGEYLPNDPFGYDPASGIPPAIEATAIYPNSARHRLRGLGSATSAAAAATAAGLDPISEAVFNSPTPVRPRDLIQNLRSGDFQTAQNAMLVSQVTSMVAKERELRETLRIAETRALRLGVEVESLRKRCVRAETDLMAAGRQRQYLEQALMNERNSSLREREIREKECGMLRQQIARSDQQLQAAQSRICTAMCEERKAKLREQRSVRKLKDVEKQMGSPSAGGGELQTTPEKASFNLSSEDLQDVESYPPDTQRSISGPAGAEDIILEICHLKMQLKEVSRQYSRCLTELSDLQVDKMDRRSPGYHRCDDPAHQDFYKRSLLPWSQPSPLASRQLPYGAAVATVAVSTFFLAPLLFMFSLGRFHPKRPLGLPPPSVDTVNNLMMAPSITYSSPSPTHAVRIGSQFFRGGFFSPAELAGEIDRMGSGALSRGGSTTFTVTSANGQAQTFVGIPIIVNPPEATQPGGPSPNTNNAMYDMVPDIPMIVTGPTSSDGMMMGDCGVGGYSQAFHGGLASASRSGRVVGQAMVSPPIQNFRAPTPATGIPAIHDVSGIQQFSSWSTSASQQPQPRAPYQAQERLLEHLRWSKQQAALGNSGSPRALGGGVNMGNQNGPPSVASLMSESPKHHPAQPQVGPGRWSPANRPLVGFSPLSQSQLQKQAAPPPPTSIDGIAIASVASPASTDIPVRPVDDPIPSTHVPASPGPVAPSPSALVAKLDPVATPERNAEQDATAPVVIDI